MMNILDYKKNLEIIVKNIKDACMRSKRDFNDVKIIAAIKYADYKQVQQLIDMGLKDLGENKTEDLIEKYNKTSGDASWHFIGHLQSRKIKKVVPIVDMIHSLDSISTAQKISDFAKSINKIQKALIEVNISKEESKYGISAENAQDFLNEVQGFKNIKITGLMTMAPFTDDTDVIRSVFRALKILKDQLNNSTFQLTELSMGMTNDYIIAVEEGATMVRIGSAIFK